jgi:hypothetical protein
MQIEITKEEYEHLDAVCQGVEQAEYDARCAIEARAEAERKATKVIEMLQRKYRIPYMPEHASREGSVYRVRWGRDDVGVDSQNPMQSRESFALIEIAPF